MPAWAADAVITVITGGFAVASAVVDGPGVQPHKNPDLLSYALIAVIVLPYLLRSKYPLTVFLVSAFGLTAYSFAGYNEGALPLLPLIGMYTVGSLCSTRQSLAVALPIAASLTLLYLDPTDGMDFGSAAGQAAFFAMALMFGTTMRSRRERLDALEARAQALEREREEEALRAVAGERLRIAQELHDVMAHSMSVIAVQAGAGAHVIERDPAAAKRALENIATTSRGTLTDLRRLLGVLRDETDSAGYAPAPGLADLGQLVREVEKAGIGVELAVDEVEGLPPGIDLTAYRIVQEALTNVIKHAGPATATVRVAARDGSLEIEVRDDGRGVSGRSDGTGHGLVGMNERVAIYGGTLVTGPVSGGGFRVCAVLPWQTEHSTRQP